MDNETLVKAIKDGMNQDGKMMLQLYQQNEGYIRKLAFGYSAGDEQLIQDMMQEGWIALAEAVDGYKEDMGVKFLTYADFILRKAFRNCLKQNGKQIVVPPNIRADIRQIKAFMNDYSIRYGCEPEPTVISYCIGIPQNQIISLLGIMKNLTIASLDAPINVEDNEELTLCDTLASDLYFSADDVIDSVFNDELSKAIWEKVEALDERQRTAIEGYYKNGESISDIAKRDDVSESYVYASLRNGYRKLQMDENLKQFYNESMAYSMAYKGGLASFKNTHTSTTEKATIILLKAE